MIVSLLLMFFSVFGFGNIGGVGEELVEHWAGVGEAVGDGV